MMHGTSRLVVPCRREASCRSPVPPASLQPCLFFLLPCFAFKDSSITALHLVSLGQGRHNASGCLHQVLRGTAPAASVHFSLP